MGYWRDIDDAPPQARINRKVHDWAGRAIAQWDPRLFLDASAPPNLQTIHALSGAVLCTNSVDAGWRVALLGEAGQPVHHWDGRGSQRWMRYDTQLRPVSVFEQDVGGEALCTECLSYGTSDQASAEHNQCGQLIRHDDPAGTQRFAEFGLHGAVLEQTRYFLNDLTLPDWPGSIADRELLLEPGEGATTRSQVNALGEVSHQTDAKGHRQLFSQTLDGQLREVRLQLNGTPTPKTLVSAITYNAQGQTEREVAGNGVITTLEYDAQNGRLTRLSAQRGNDALQDLNYAYDPVGNVLSIKDIALPIRYFANQRIEPVNCYFYDSLSQLIEATGWEAGGANKGPQFSTFDDPAPRANYRQTYHYNLGGSLLELTHKGPQNHAHRLVSAAHSNRCLPVLEGVEPGEGDFRQGFDGDGNLLKLQPGQALAWDLRNQLGEVRPVVRDSGVNDRERYVYGADGMRLRKVRETLAHARTLVAETRYLPNLELRNYSGTGEVLQVINVEAGRSSVRVLHWESETPKDAANDQYRYHLNDHLGSCTLELDNDGEVISQERYHPYGTTAWFAGRGEVEASYRTVRYSGKERDATGLYYYRFRYYVAGWQRWLNPDPAGEVDGLNFYRMVRNNPARWFDEYGLSPDTPPALRRKSSIENIQNIIDAEKNSAIVQGPSGQVSNTQNSDVSLSMMGGGGKGVASDFTELVARIEQSSSSPGATESRRSELGIIDKFFSLLKKTQPVPVVTEDDFVAVNIVVNSGAPVHGPVNLKRPFDARRWTMNRDPMIVYRQDNRGIEEVVNAGGFQPRELELDTLEEHMLKSRNYKYVSTSDVRLKGGSYGVYEYKIKLVAGQGIDTGAYLRTVFGAMIKKKARITEFSIPGAISPMQIVGVRKWSK
ncbi:RHS repeat domain-containing protein [Pseudomonas laurylsulfatiphila]|uniref:RHS repeat domain-containing protein n=1 Tax=Pseudomonas laurylsulfatiphila TaxID=2011015 RepID=UPI00215ED685|nr:RHS repeat-associated core domain-containing protein [Pseudomonas laurylsulfatiphila]UVM04180.1 toxin [Pseudomonas laurylsulfatiphila]